MPENKCETSVIELQLIYNVFTSWGKKNIVAECNKIRFDQFNKFK